MSDAQPGSSVACERCGDFTDVQRAGYDDQGRLVCKACEVRGDIDAADVRAAGGIVTMGAGAFSLALLAFFFNPMLLASVGAILSALGCLRTMRAHPEYTRRMGWKKVPTVALCVGAIFLEGGRLFLLFGAPFLG
jgi:hypothetical protein